MNNQIQAIIFDMDGVLIDSEHLHYEAEHQIFEERGIQPPKALWENFVGKTEEAVFAYIIEHYSDGQYSIDDLLQAKYAIFPQLLAEELQTIPGALEFIRHVRAQYSKIALTTSSQKAMQEKVFEMFKLHPYFDVVVTGNEITHGKPHPEPYLKTVAALNLDADHCLVVEDAAHGITAAKAAGCQVAGLTTSFAPEILAQAGADLVVDNYSALIEYLAANGEAVIP